MQATVVSCALYHNNLDRTQAANPHAIENTEAIGDKRTSSVQQWLSERLHPSQKSHPQETRNVMPTLAHPSQALECNR